MKKDKKFHHLFHGELSDAPGRNEEWDHYLVYRSNGQWVLITESTDFSGTVEEPPSKELMGSRQLLSWAIDRDNDIKESEGLDQLSDDDEDVKQLGPFVERLKEISIDVGSQFCVALIDRWVRGSWPPGVKEKKLVVRCVTGVARRGVWIRMYHYVYQVDTNLGPAYMYEPSSDGYAKVTLKSESSMSQGKQTKLSKQILAQVKIFHPEMNKLKSESA